MTSNPDQRLWPFQTRQMHAVEMQPGRHKQVSCSRPAFSPSYQGLCICVVLHRPEAFVSSCRTSLSSQVTCVAIEPILTSQTGEFTAMRPVLSHAATSNSSQVARSPCGCDALDSKLWESMSRFLCLSENEKWNLPFQTDHTMLQADMIPAGISPLLQPQNTIRFLHLSGSLSTTVCFEHLQLWGSQLWLAGHHGPQIEISVCRCLCSSLPVLGLP